jgi:uncharacterized damage-inducible protein DinB
MKEILTELSEYHFWANQRLTDLCQTMADDRLDQDTPGSFPTLRRTWYHLWDAEQIWMQRLNLAAHVIPPSATFSGTFQEFIHLFLQSNQSMIAYTARLNESAFDHMVEYYDSKKQPYKTAIYECLVQVFNHGTYHRGQIVSMMRALGATKLPSTDYIAFKRKKK